jgi:hypothetical protein
MSAATAAVTMSATATAAGVVMNDMLGHVVMDDHVAIAMHHAIPRLLDNDGLCRRHVSARDRNANDVVGPGWNVDVARRLNDGWSRSPRPDLRRGNWPNALRFEQWDPVSKAVEVEPLQTRPGCLPFEDEQRLGRILAKHLADRLTLAIDDAEFVQFSVDCRRIELDFEMEVFERARRITRFRLCVPMGVALRDLRNRPGSRTRLFSGSLGHQDHCHRQEKHESTHRMNLLVAGPRMRTNATFPIPN